MAESDAQDKTEEPTARKLRKARDEGQVARSIELPAAAITIGTFLLLMMGGGWIAGRLAEQFAQGFVFDRKTLLQPEMLPGLWADAVSAALIWVAPILLLTVILAIVASGMTGGYLLSWKAISPKWEKINPVAGMARIFSMRSLVELGKSLLKFSLVALVLWAMVMIHMDELAMLGRMGLEPGLAAAGRLLAQSALAVSLTLALIALVDVPYQRHAFMKRMRMSKQEIKDEMKDLEGRPEIKAAIRRRQREMAQRRMLQRIKDADVVVTNPSHFAVAMEYDPAGDGAPIVLAKGADFLAQRIKEEASEHGVYLFQAPDLARALYFSTEENQPIPESLYHAVALVIAYVFSLEATRPGQQGMRKPQPQVPSSMLFDTDGRRIHPEAQA